MTWSGVILPSGQILSIGHPKQHKERRLLMLFGRYLLENAI